MDKARLKDLAGLNEARPTGAGYVDMPHDYYGPASVDPSIPANDAKRTYAVGAIINNVAKGHLGKRQAVEQLLQQGYTEEEARRVFG